VSFFVSGCGPGQILGPTITPVPPLKCNINTEGYHFDIADESGSFRDSFTGQTERGDMKSGEVVKITLNVNFERVYKESQHKYHFVGTIITNKIANDVTYDIVVTGDTFKSPQTCMNT
jgi:hypothetical protein